MHDTLAQVTSCVYVIDCKKHCTKELKCRVAHCHAVDRPLDCEQSETGKTTRCPMPAITLCSVVNKEYVRSPLLAHLHLLSPNPQDRPMDPSPSKVQSRFLSTTTTQIQDGYAGQAAEVPNQVHRTPTSRTWLSSHLTFRVPL